MRGVYASLGTLAIFALGTSLAVRPVAAAERAGHVIISENWAPDEQPPAPQPVSEAVSDDCPCSAAGACGCQCHQRRNCYARALDKWAEVGRFNCSCRGSYKFPVPPQYTYHWPGMYSQQAMTQYNSPYRFPALRQPPPAEAEPDAAQEVGPPVQKNRFQIRQVGRIEPTGQTRTPSQPLRPEPISQKIKRHYRLD